MNLGRPERADALAAEYVLGTLRGRARQRFERAVRADRALGDAVQRWEERLLPLAEGLVPVNPPERVWRAIQARIGSAPASRSTLWSSLGWWRGLALVSLVAVVALSVLLLRPMGERAEGTVVAVLAGSDAKAALVASADRFGRYLTIKAISRIDVPADRSLQLWMLPSAGNPQSLGVIDTTTAARVALSAPADEALRNIPALAVSLEPRGGSPTGSPTGPVLYSGAVQRTY
jgi:anti-sigma-K factor RskA